MLGLKLLIGFVDYIVLCYTPFFDLIFFYFYSSFKPDFISSLQTKFRQRGILKYFILVPKATIF